MRFGLRTRFCRISAPLSIAVAVGVAVIRWFAEGAGRGLRVIMMGIIWRRSHGVFIMGVKVSLWA